jgi:hypothetical protein
MGDLNAEATFEASLDENWDIDAKPPLLRTGDGTETIDGSNEGRERGPQEGIEGTSEGGTDTLSEDPLQVETTSSSESDLPEESPSLFERYREVLLEIHRAVQEAEREVHDATQEADKAVAREASLFLKNACSILVCWGCDIRVETDSLKTIQGSMLSLAIRSIFENIKSHLQTFARASAFHESKSQLELLNDISHLKDYANSIRMSQAVNSRRGPYDGIRERVELLAKQEFQTHPSYSAPPTREKILSLNSGVDPTYPDVLEHDPDVTSSQLSEVQDPEVTSLRLLEADADLLVTAASSTNQPDVGRNTEAIPLQPIIDERLSIVPSPSSTYREYTAHNPQVVSSRPTREQDVSLGPAPPYTSNRDMKPRQEVKSGRQSGGGKQTISIMANNTGNGPITRFQDVQVHQDSMLDCCLISKSSATTLLGECKAEPVDLTVSGDGGRVFSCSHKFEARWCYKGVPYTQPVTLFIAPDLGEGAIFPESLISRISSSGAPLAPVEFRPRNQSMFAQLSFCSMTAQG